MKEKLLKLLRTKQEQREALNNALVDSQNKEERSAIGETLKKLAEEIADVEEMLSKVDEPIDDNSRAFNPFAAATGLGARSFDNGSGETRSENGMNTKEIRSFQKYLTKGGVKALSESEARALDLSGSAAVLPVAISNELITSDKFSDLLHRAKVFNDGGAGKLYIPIASSNLAEWHEENEAATEATPTLTKIELGGFELLRLMQMSAASYSMTEASFKQSLMQLLSSEVIETLEYSFINGSGSGQPKGLASLTWTDGTNAIKTTSDITFKDIATGLSKLPQKYARNAIHLMSSNTAYNIISTAEDSIGSPIFNVSEAASKVLGREVVISEHCPDDTIFIVDASQLYVRFAMPLTVEADGSSGFTSASINIRALTVVDAAWNPAACIKVYKAAAQS